jgi:hypothetical protein
LAFAKPRINLTATRLRKWQIAFSGPKNPNAFCQMRPRLTNKAIEKLTELELSATSACSQKLKVHKAQQMNGSI